MMRLGTLNKALQSVKAEGSYSSLISMDIMCNDINNA